MKWGVTNGMMWNSLSRDELFPFLDIENFGGNVCGPNSTAHCSGNWTLKTGTKAVSWITLFPWLAPNEYGTLCRCHTHVGLYILPSKQCTWIMTPFILMSIAASTFFLRYSSPAGEWHCWWPDIESDEQTHVWWIVKGMRVIEKTISPINYAVQVHTWKGRTTLILRADSSYHFQLPVLYIVTRETILLEAHKITSGYKWGSNISIMLCRVMLSRLLHTMRKVLVWPLHEDCAHRWCPLMYEVWRVSSHFEVEWSLLMESSQISLVNFSCF